MKVCTFLYGIFIVWLIQWGVTPFLNLKPIPVLFQHKRKQLVQKRFSTSARGLIWITLLPTSREQITSTNKKPLMPLTALQKNSIWKSFGTIVTFKERHTSFKSVFICCTSSFEQEDISETK